MQAGKLIRVALLLAVAASIVYVALFSDIKASDISIRRVREFVEGFGMLGPVVLVGLYTIRPVFPIVSPLPVAIAIGAIYGTLAGTIMVAAGSTGAGLFGFFLARFVGRDYVARKAAKAGRLQDIKERVERGGWATVMVARFMNIPWDVVSFASGLSDIKLRDFLTGTAIPAIPLSFIAVYFGSALSGVGSFSDLLKPGPLSALAVFVLGITLPLVLKRKLDQDAPSAQDGHRDDA